MRIHQRIEAMGLYQGQPPLLRELWKQEGQTQKDLASKMNITPATITKMLQRMEKAGFIQRKPDPTDQRVTRVFLTDLGRNVQQELESAFRALEAETFANLSQEELALMYRFLTQIRQNLLNVTGEEPWK
jgi:DNA-binding MarR family transcriptional regulator